MELWRLLAHNHWFTLTIHRYQLRLCARCSGYLLGFVASLLVIGHLSDPGVQWYVFFLLAIPLIIDWVSQSWGLRNSNNNIRLITGILMGIDVFLFSKYGINPQMGQLIFIGAALTVTFIGLVGKILRPHQFQCVA